MLICSSYSYVVLCIIISDPVDEFIITVIHERIVNKKKINIFYVNSYRIMSDFTRKCS